MRNFSFNLSTQKRTHLKVIHSFIVMGAVSLLSACAITEIPMSLRPGQGHPDNQLELRGEGYQQFKCVKDEQGYYWQYLKTEAFLYPHSPIVLSISDPKDAIGRMNATSSSSQIFIHNDGSRVRSTRVLKHIKAPANGNIQWMRMAAQSNRNGSKAFDSIRYILRVDTRGGMPFVPCDYSHLGELHDSGFLATYVFWK